MGASTLRFLVGVAMLLAVAPLGLPIENTWFSGFISGITCVGFFVAAVVSMPEPKDEQAERPSSMFYVWIYRFGHSLLHLGTAYFAHPTLWKHFKASTSRDGRRWRDDEAQLTVRENERTDAVEARRLTDRTSSSNRENQGN